MKKPGFPLGSRVFSKRHLAYFEEAGAGAGAGDGQQEAARNAAAAAARTILAIFIMFVSVVWLVSSIRRHAGTQCGAL